jgi:hypothetical protein
VIFQPERRKESSISALSHSIGENVPMELTANWDYLEIMDMRPPREHGSLRYGKLLLELVRIQPHIALNKRGNLRALGNGDVLTVHKQEEGCRRPQD